MGILKDIGHAITHNHTLQFLTDPVKPIEKVVSTGYKDTKAVVSYGGKHLVQDVDQLSSSFSMNLPLLIGGVVIVVFLQNRK